LGPTGAPYADIGLNRRIERTVPASDEVSDVAAASVKGAGTVHERSSDASVSVEHLSDERSSGVHVSDEHVLDPRRWRTLILLAVAQVTVVIDLTIVNVALPDAQRALHISDDARQWVVTSYALAFGSLLLIGGRVADYWGRKRAFITGLIGFAAASALGGAAVTSTELFAARALQGVFGALLAPAGLSLLQVAFPSGRERNRAFAIFGAVAGGGAAVGSVLGGVLTEYANWRWCLYVNVPVVIVAVIFAVPMITESKAHGDTRYDIPGALSATLGLGALVYGFTSAASNGWGSPTTIGSLGTSAVALAAFVIIERRSPNPLVPLAILMHPSRGGSFLTALLAGAGLLGTLLFQTYYLQITLGYTPLKAGLSMLPTTLIFVLGTRMAEALTSRFGTKSLMVVGAFTSSVGIALLSRITINASYATTVLPSQIVLGVGLVALFIPLSNAALFDVPDHDAGAGGALLNATQQVGSAVGVAIFSTIYASASSGYLTSHKTQLHAVAQSQVHGYVVAFLVAAAVMFSAGLVAVFFIKIPKGATASTTGHGGPF
jgi:EmrB/QacA subfamily drug resistance transporter